MSLQSVRAALAASISAQGTIDLYAAAEDSADLAPIKPLLALFGIDSSYIWSGAALDPNTTSVRLEGRGVLGGAYVQATSIAGTLLCTGIGDGAVTFVLSMAVTTPGWTLGAFFRGLPEYERYDAASLTVGWVTPSFLDGTRINRAVFSVRSDEQPTPRLHLSGDLPSQAPYDTYDHIVFPWPLRLTGTVVMPVAAGEAPMLDLRAVSTSATIGIAEPLLDFSTPLEGGGSGLTLRDVGFRLACFNDLDADTWGRTAFTVLDLIGTLSIGELRAQLSTPVLATGDVWHLIAEFDEDNPGIVTGIAQLTTLFGLPALPLPSDFPVLSGFQFRIVELWFQPPTDSDGPKLDYIAVSIESNKAWRAPVPFVTIKNVGTRWVWGWAETNGSRFGYISGSIFGSVEFGGGDGNGGAPALPALPAPEGTPGGGSLVQRSDAIDPFTIDAVAYIPSWAVSGSLRADSVIPIGAAFSAFFGNPGPPTQSDAYVTGLTFQADPQNQTFDATAEITFGLADPLPPGWAIDLGVTTITVRQMSFAVSVVGGELSGSMQGEFGLTDGLPPPRMVIAAYYPGPADKHPEGWTFTGDLYPGDSVALTDMAARFLGVATPVPDWVPALDIDRLSFSVNTGTPTAYRFSGAVSMRWQPRIFDTPLKIAASAGVDLAKAGTAQSPSGHVEGMFSVNAIALSARLPIGPDVKAPTYQFKVQFGDLWLQAFTSWRGPENNQHQVISLQLGGVTVGDILEYLVNLAQPTLGYTLEAPWDVLKRIDLSRFVLTLDPQESTVELVYTADADLVFMRLDTIGVRYTRSGNDGGVSLILTGSILGKSFEGPNALSWDVVNDPPPALPGQKQEETIIDLRYLGLGQRVALVNPPDSVAASLARLRQDMSPDQKPDHNPLDGQAVRFDANSQWLIGLDVGVLDTVDIGLIFNDPRLYGLSIQLGGERAGSLAGLRFEILYKKITDDVGMFRIELRVPEAFRHIELGEVSITLGLVVVEIYTNGNFLIDLGFPYDRNYERSFSVQVFPFIGRGGVYFGVLDGNTSRRVPRIGNGSFAPVLELGIGLAVGVGKEIRIGPLSGGIYVQVEVIFQGVLGWFNPSAAGMPTATYYWGQGIAAIHGKLYGSVDFKVIKVSVTLDAYAQASVVFEACRPTVFRLAVGVSVEAEVEFLFFSVSFSFDIDLDVSFTIGSERPTPWLIASDAPPAGALPRTNVLLPAPRRSPLRRVRALHAEHRRMRARMLRERPHAEVMDGDAGSLHWKPSQAVFSDSPRNAAMTLLPCLSIGDLPVAWQQDAPANPAPRYRAAFLLFADSGASAHARTAAAASLRTAAMHAQSRNEGMTDYLATDIWVRGFLLYALNALQPDATPIASVSAGQLAFLSAELDRQDAADVGFSYQNLESFFLANIHLDVTGDADVRHGARQGMAVPIPPPLSWTSPQGGDIDFATHNPIGSLYEWGVATWLATYATEGARPAATPPVDGGHQSYATAVFRDFCLMLAKAAVKEAIAALENVELAATTATQSLADIANAQPQASVSYAFRAGDSVESIAGALGASVQELAFLNPGLAALLRTASPGSELTLKLGVSPDLLAQDNADVVFAKANLPLGRIDYQVVANDTFHGIAGRFGMQPARLFEVPTLADDARILAAGVAFDIPAASYTPPQGFTAVSVAATFYIRYAGQPLPTSAEGERAAWYAQAVFDMNRSALQLPLQAANDVELPPGTALFVPTAWQAGVRPAQANYVTVPGDTLARIGAALDLAQNHASDPGSTGWPAFRDGVVLSGGSASIPAWTGTRVLVAETPAMLARRCILYWTRSGGTWQADWPGLLGLVGGAAILAPLALLAVPSARTDATTLYSFATLSETYGLAIADAAMRVQGVQGLYAEGTVLAVKHLPVQTTEALAAAVCGGVHLVNVIAQSSRMLLAGAQLPVPSKHGEIIEAGTTLAPLLDLTGQQFDVPVDAADPNGTALDVAVTTTPGWIALMGSTTVRQGETADGLRERAPQAFDPRLNPGLAHGRAPRAGMVVHTGIVSALTFLMSNSTVVADAPATSLSLTPHTGPAAMPLKASAPRTYGLDHRVTLQSAAALPIPGMTQLSGPASLWRFPQALVERARAGVATPYEILGAEHGNADGSASAELSDSTFAAMLPFQVRRADRLPRLLNLVGAPTGQRDVLLSLREYLTAAHTPAGTVAYLLLPPPPTAADNSGLAVIGQNPAAVSLVKTNLSTESVPQPSALAREARRQRSTGPALHFATLSQLADFVLLLWEGSTVGGSGYFIDLGQDIAGSAFDDQGLATLQLLVIAGEQQASAPAGRKLLRFNNCALLASGADPAAQALYVEAADDSDLIEQALVPAGNLGFTLSLPRPVDATDPVEQAAVRLARQYSLLTAATASTPGAVFDMPASGLPLTPQAMDGVPIPAWKRHRLQRRGQLPRRRTLSTPPVGYWHYQQVIPVFRFGTASPLPAVAGLPAPGDDPYRGTGTYPVSGGTRQPPPMNLLIGVADIAGNRSAAADGKALVVQAGYTDPLIGPSAWPATVTGYGVTGTGTNAAIAIGVAPKGAALMPSPAQRGDSLRTDATRQQQSYAQIYYQLGQPGVTAAVFTPLAVAADGHAFASVAPLGAYAAAAYLYAGAAASITALAPAAAANLGQVPAAYGVDWSLLAQANQDEALSDLFGPAATFTVPAYAVMTDQATANQIAAVPRPGWPAPAAAAMLKLTQNASHLPLRIGTVLAVPARTVAIPQTATSLNEFAATLGTSAPLLATDSATDAALRDGFAMTMDGVTVTVGQTRVPGSTTQTVQSFAQALAAFAGQGIHLSASDLALVFGERADLLAAGASLHTAHYIAGNDDTLDSNKSQTTTEDLIAANLATPNLFDNGALIYLGDFSAGAGTAIAPDAGETLRQFSDRYACPPEQLLAANPGLALPAGTTLAVPGAAALSAPEGVIVPYRVQGGDTLQAIGGRFFAQGDASAGLVTANQAMPGIIVAGQALSVQVGNTAVPVTTLAGDTFASILVRVKVAADSATLADVAAAAAGKDGLLQTGALMLCPPAKLPTTVAPSGIASLYNVTAESFALANAGVAGLIAAGATLHSPLTNGPVVQTQDRDTFNSLMARFATAYALAGLPASLGIADIVQANADVAFLAQGALALLPPAPATMSATMGSGPYPGPAFALQVVLRLQRPAALIHPDFAQDGPVARVDSTIPPPARSADPGQGGFLGFNDFVASMRNAFPLLRLATGKVAGRDEDLWAVDFGPSGVANVQLTQGVGFGDRRLPRFLTLAPLYRSLVSRAQVPIQKLTAEGRLDGVPVDHDYQGIDVEVWARRFLADVDLLLSTDYASAIYALPGSRPDLARVLDAKATLATAIPEALGSVFKVASPQPPADPHAVQDPNLAAGIAKAQEALTQRLGVSLSEAYAITTLIQYDAAITSPWIPSSGQAALPPANLEGTARDTQSALPAGGELPWRLTSAKTPLDERAPFVTMMMTVSDPSAQRSLAVDLEYAVSNLEFNIARVNAAPGYVASDWLSFMPLLSGAEAPASLHTSLGAAQVPVVLRSFPGEPIIHGQGAAASVDSQDGTATLSTAALWTYSVSYSHEHAAQDTVLLTAEFNLHRPSALPRAEPPTTDLFTELAKYIAVADGLWALLAAAIGPATATPATTIANAMATFAGLAENIANHWTLRLSEAASIRRANGVGAEWIADLSLTFDASVGYRTDAQGVRCIDRLTLHGHQADPGPAGAAWPQVWCRGADGEPVALTASPPSERTVVFSVPADTSIPAVTWPMFTLAWKDLNVSSVQNARTRLAVVRNQWLTSSSGPATNPDLVFQTGTVTATDIATPLNTWSRTFALSGASVAIALDQALQTLFPAAARLPDTHVTMGLFYGYELIHDPAHAEHSLVSELPVGLYADQPLSAQTASQVGTALDAWMSANRPNVHGGQWILSFILYSRMDSAKRPLLSIERMSYAIS